MMEWHGRPSAAFRPGTNPWPAPAWWRQRSDMSSRTVGETSARAGFRPTGAAGGGRGAVPGPRGASTRVTAIPDRFLAMRYPRGYGPSQLVGAAFSIDGRTWTEVVGGPAGFAPRIVTVGDRVIGMDNDAAGGAGRVWVGSISRGILTWRRAPGADAAFEGGLVTA